MFELAITTGMGLLSLASALVPLLGIVAIFVLAQTWQPLTAAAPAWLRFAYQITRYYVFAVLIVALLWLLAAVLVVNTDFWSLYDPDVEADPVPALEHALEHWEELGLP